MLLHTEPRTTVEEIAHEAGISALRIQRLDGIDIFVTRWAGRSGGEAVVDPLTKITVPIGSSFTLARVRGGMVQQWSDVRENSADIKAPHGTASSKPGGGKVREQHQCVNEIQGERLR